MNAAPANSAAFDDARALSGSPRPTDWPTRTDAAWAIPTGTMKVRAARLMAT
jgi:hypothetical protein